MQTSKFFLYFLYSNLLLNIFKIVKFFNLIKIAYDLLLRHFRCIGTIIPCRYYKDILQIFKNFAAAIVYNLFSETLKSKSLQEGFLSITFEFYMSCLAKNLWTTNFTMAEPSLGGTSWLFPVFQFDQIIFYQNIELTSPMLISRFNQILSKD